MHTPPITRFAGFLLLFALISAGCTDDSPGFSHMACSLSDDVEVIKNHPAIAIYTDSLSRRKLNAMRYFFLIDKTHLPLIACNVGHLESVQPGDSVAVIISGKYDILPPTVDADAINFKASKIEVKRD